MDCMNWNGKEWFRVPGYDSYFASKDGDILSVKAEPKVLNKISTPDGHQYVFMYKDRRMQKIWVHRAVLSAVCGKDEPDLICRHLDDDPENNNVENLEWGSKQENANDRKRNKGYPDGEKSCTAKLTNEKVMEIRKRYADGESSRDLSKEFGVSRNEILEIARGSTWKNLPVIKERVKHSSRRKTPLTEEQISRFVEGGKRYAASRRKSRELIACECGCGTLIEMHDSKGRRRRFAHGHNAQGKHWKWRNNSGQHN